MQVLLATYGSRGDVEPMVAIATELQALGARVRLCAPPDPELQPLFARSGAEVVEFDRSWRSWATRETNAEERVFNVDDYVNDHLEATFAPLAAAAAGADLLLATGMLHFVASTVAEHTRIPHRFALFAPSVLEPMPWQGFVVAALDAHRATLGLRPIADVHAFLYTANPWVAAEPLLSPPPVDSPAVRTGAWLLRDDRPLPPALEAFLAAGGPPVYVGFGSMRVGDDEASVVIDAARALGRRVVVGRGWAELALPGESAEVFAVDEVNQQSLFPQVAAVIHHGGAGTTTAAARAGTPQLVVPQAADQPYWGERVAALGVGAVHDGPVPTPASITAALTTALDPQTARAAREVASRITTDGAKEAARRLLDVARG